MQKEYDKILRLIENHEVVTFDIFDTLLLRDVVTPVDIFAIVEKKYDISNFKKNRIRAEITARHRSNYEDVTYDEIYSNMDKSINSNLEYDVECDFLTCNTFMKKIYDRCIEQGKKIILITDMYLSKVQISHFLKINGYERYHELYVSSELKKTKASGSIFAHIQAKEGISKNNWIHMGDNYVSDFENAKKFGINAYHYDVNRDNIACSKFEDVGYSILKALQLNSIRSNNDLNYWDKFGITNVSQIMWSFVNWLIKDLKDSKRDNIYFLARDGYLPMKVYEKICEKDETLPRAKYLYASRRAFMFPNIINLSDEDAVKVITQYNSSLGQSLSVKDLLRDLQIDFKENELIFEKYQININTKINNDTKHINLQNALICIIEKIKENMKVEYDNLLSYLKQEGVFEFNEINVVDIGWKGSIQKSLQDIAGLKTNGYFFGVGDDIYPEIKENVKGYAFQNGKNKKIKNKILDNIMMYEFIFTSPEPSVIKFRRVNNVMKPVFKNATCEKKEVDYYEAVLNQIELYLDKEVYLKNISVVDTINDYNTFIEEKNYEDLKQFYNITANVGISDFEQKNYVVKININDYKKNKSIYKDKLSKSLWNNAGIVYGSFHYFNSNKFDLSQIKLINKVKWFLKHRLIKGIKNPKRAYKYLLNKFCN